MLIQVQKENEQDEAHIFQYNYFESFQIHQLTIMYHFEHINYGNHYNINIFIMLNHLQSLSIQVAIFIFNSASFTFFIIASIFTFNVLSSFWNIFPKI